MKKRNKSLEEELKYKPSHKKEEKEDFVDQEDEEMTKSINRIAKYANKYFPEKFQVKVEKSPSSDEESEPEVKYKVNLNNPSFLNEDLIDSHPSCKKAAISQSYEPEE
jgi:hypothetical protein